MPRPFVILLSEPDEELREAIETTLGRDGAVHTPPPDYGIDQVKLILDILSDGATIATGVAGVTAVLIKLRGLVAARPKHKRARFKILGDGRDVVLTELSDEELRKLAEESRR